MNMTKDEAIKELDAAIKHLQYAISNARYDRVDISRVLRTISQLDSIVVYNLFKRCNEILSNMKFENISAPEADTLMTCLTAIKQDIEVKRLLVIGNGFLTIFSKECMKKKQGTLYMICLT